MIISKVAMENENTKYYKENPFITFKIERKSTFTIQGYGVYMFLDSEFKPIYIGFSSNLQERIHGHFRAAGLMKFIPEARYLKILFNKTFKDEADLIAWYKPKYNGIAIGNKCNKKTMKRNIKTIMK